MVDPWDDPAQVPLISFAGVSKQFGDVTALDQVDLDIYGGEFFALLGPSGCGKTTLMRMLAGFETPTGGKITLGGQDMAGIPPNQRPVNMMFQSYALFPHMSVWDNIAFGLRRDGMAGDELATRVEEMLRLVQLGKLARRKPDQISGGQKQRVALARALARAPQVLLLDEPLAALDKKLRQETQFELVDIQEKTGTTFVIVTHDQEEAMTMSTRIAVMEEGRIRQIATPNVLYEHPNSRYVADFVGDVNLIAARVNADGSFDWAEGCPPFQVQTKQVVHTDQQVCLAVRPEKVLIRKNKQDLPNEMQGNEMQGKVIDIAYSGNLSTYVVEIAGGQKIRAQTANTRRFASLGITWNDPVWLYWGIADGVVLVD